MSARKVGIRQVAAAAGVSVTTVSHALNGKGRLPDATRERVRDVAERLGYRPSAAARNLVGGKTGLLGLTVSQPAGRPLVVGDFAYFVDLMSAASAAAIQRGYALVLTPGEHGRHWPDIDLDGAIVVDPVAGDPLVQELRQRNVPVVTTGRVPAPTRRVRGSTTTTLPARSPCWSTYAAAAPAASRWSPPSPTPRTRSTGRPPTYAGATAADSSRSCRPGATASARPRASPPPPSCSSTPIRPTPSGRRSTGSRSGCCSRRARTRRRPW
jgi:AcrR family transcriptional regulator